MVGELHNLLSRIYIRIYEFDREHYGGIQIGVPYNYFGLLIEGKATFHSPYCDFTLEEGDLVYIPKGCCYTSHWTSDKKVRFYSLGFSFLKPETAERYLLQKIDNCDELKEKIESMYEARNTPNIAVGIFYYLYEKACTVLKKDNRDKKHLSVYPAVQYIREHCCEEFSVAHLAKLCGMSESYFYPVFKSEMNCTPVRYKNRIKCSKAVDLLITGDDTLEVICDKLNISSPAFLRKLLKQETGKTPKEIRRKKYTI